MSFEYHSYSVLNFLNSILELVELLVICASIFSNCTIETERLRIIKTTKNRWAHKLAVPANNYQIDNLK